jgi:transcriptional regulator with XRE-family HTH domain
MTENQYRNCIDMLGLSQKAAAKLLGVSPRTSRGYALGERRIPEPVAKLLRLMIRLQIKPEDVP